MACKPAFDARRFVRVGIAATTWVLSVTAMQAVAGAEIRKGVRQLERRIELRLNGDEEEAAPPSAEPRERTHHDEPIEPWELVSV